MGLEYLKIPPLEFVMFQKGNNNDKQSEIPYNTEIFKKQSNTHNLHWNCTKIQPFYYIWRRVQLLKLATRAKFHLGKSHMMKMIIVLDSSFREVQVWYKYHLIRTSAGEILNLFSHAQIVKVSLNVM